MELKEAAALIQAWLKASEQATPGPWHCPSANVFRLFAWEDCGEDGKKPRRCIVPDSMADVRFGSDEVKWPQTDTAAMEACWNLRFIAASREMPEALRVLLRAGLEHADCFRAALEGNSLRVPQITKDYMAAITPLLERRDEEEEK